MSKEGRGSIRLPGYAYTQPGAYFVTTCSWQSRLLFGTIERGEMFLNSLGRIVQWRWQGLALQFRHIRLGAFVVMPNHVHGVIVIESPAQGDNVGATQAAPDEYRSGQPLSLTGSQAGKHGSPLRARPTGPPPGSLGAMMAQFKSRATKQIWALPNQAQFPVWQRNYYEHIIRDEADWQRIEDYIRANPARWADDCFHRGG
ncbi:MAG: transposase [Chloroflexi bacterium]|nr:transposase [Chloroflexota bacterium]